MSASHGAILQKMTSGKKQIYTGNFGTMRDEAKKKYWFEIFVWFGGQMETRWPKDYKIFALQSDNSEGNNVYI